LRFVERSVLSPGKLMLYRRHVDVHSQLPPERLSVSINVMRLDPAQAWFDQYGFADGEYGVAETLSKAKNTSVGGMVAAGILAARAGKVRLLRPEELPPAWDPAADPRLTVWEMVHHLVRALDQGEMAAAALIAALGSRAETARELAYRLYTLCERKKRAAEALAYNALVQSWPELARLARDVRPQQEALL
jgi:putative DNA methylase